MMETVKCEGTRESVPVHVYIDEDDGMDFGFVKHDASATLIVLQSSVT